MNLLITWFLVQFVINYEYSTYPCKSWQNWMRSCSKCHFIVFQESASSFNDSKLHKKTFVISVSSGGLGCLKPDQANFVTLWWGFQFTLSVLLCWVWKTSDSELALTGFPGTLPRWIPLKKCNSVYENIIWNVQAKNAMYELKCKLSLARKHEKYIRGYPWLPPVINILVSINALEWREALSVLPKNTTTSTS